MPVVQHRLDDARELVQRRLDRPRDRGRAQRGHAIGEIGLAPQLVVVELELLAGGEDRRRPRRRAAAVADRGLEAEGDDHRPRGARIVRHPRGRDRGSSPRPADTRAACGSRLDLLRLSRCSSLLGVAGYIVSIGSSSRIASSKAP